MAFDVWRLRDFAPGQGFAAGAQTIGYDDGDWLPIDVPGDVHRTLIGAGRIPDPHYDRNERGCAWMEDREWWYRTTIEGPDSTPDDGERRALVFHGLDTFAHVWLNGQLVGRHRNMFRPLVLDVTDGLRPAAANMLAVCSTHRSGR